jgi:hypothetical protein
MQEEKQYQPYHYGRWIVKYFSCINEDKSSLEIMKLFEIMDLC